MKADPPSKKNFLFSGGCRSGSALDQDSLGCMDPDQGRKKDEKENKPSHYFSKTDHF
jgi:hypothetical protein